MLGLTHVQRGTDRVDYVAVRDADSLADITQVEAGRAVLVIAAFVGKTRLIDNAVIG